MYFLSCVEIKTIIIIIIIIMSVSPFTINNVSVCLKKIAGYSPAVSLCIIFFCRPSSSALTAILIVNRL